MPRLLIGLGTGRCGTMSLARLLNEQDGFSVTHECAEHLPLPWKPDRDMLMERMARIQERKERVVGDVASYWLPYVGWMMVASDDVKVICIERSKTDTVQSFLVGSVFGGRNKNQFSRTLEPGEKKTPGAVRFPQFDLPKVEAIRAYWDLYCQCTNALCDLYPEAVRKWQMEAVLNDAGAQKEMLCFAGVAEGKERLMVGLKLNATETRREMVP